MQIQVNDVSTNGEFIADVKVLDRDTGECVARSVRVGNANDLDGFIGEVESAFGPETAGGVKTTLDDALQDHEAAHAPQPKAGIRPVLIRASTVEPKEIDWLWPGKFALGKLNILCGDPGVNKSTLTIDMLAHVSTGCNWPDGSACPKGSAIILSAEDDPADTMRPRMDKACADVTKVHFLDGINMPMEDGTNRVKGFTLDNAVVLADAIDELGDCRLVIIDPVSAYLADADSHKNAEIRGLLAPIAKVAAEKRVCVILVTHLNKAASGKALHRAMGSLAFVAAARSAWLVVKDKQIPRRRLVLPIKNNIGNDTDGMAFTVESDDVPYIAWEAGPVRTRADEALAEHDDGEDSKTGPEPVARGAAEGWLRDLLGNGPIESDKVKAEAKAAGMSWATVRRAQSSLGIKPFRNQFGGAWMWKLPATGANQDAHAEDAHPSPIREQPEQREQPEHLRDISQKKGGMAPYGNQDAQVAQVFREVGANLSTFGTPGAHTGGVR